MLSLKSHAIITGGLLAAIIVMAMIGNVLHDQGYIPDSSTSQFAAARMTILRTVPGV